MPTPIHVRLHRIHARLHHKAIISSTALALALMAHPALAKDGSAPAPAPASDAAETGEDAGVREVVVTAQRVKANLQNTPISITTFSDKDLKQQNIHDFQDLRGLVPNLEILPQGGGGAGVYGRNQTTVIVRGVGTSQRFLNQDARVGVYVDDLYQATTYLLNLGFYDIGNVQVLKGPQGTLFGKNTIGGALLAETHAPDKEFGGYGQLSVGSYNRIDAQGAINIPFADTVQGRVSFYSSDVDGYINHLLDTRKSNDSHEKSIRGQLRVTPTSRLTLDFKAEYGASHDSGNAYIITQINPNATYVKNYNSVNAIPYQTAYAPLGLRYTIYGDTVSKFPSGNYLPGTYGSMLPFDRGTNQTYQLRATWKLSDELTLKSITGYKNVSLDSYRTDGTPGGLYTEYNEFRVKQFSQELQLLGNFFHNRLNVVGGAFYIKQTYRSNQITGPDYVDPVGYYYANTGSFPSLAAYLQATAKLTRKLSLTLGGRYTHDLKNTASVVWTSGCTGNFLNGYTTGTGGCWVPGPNGNTWAAASKSWQHADPRVELDYQWTPSLMTYASITSGYQSGGFNTQNAPGIPANVPYNQENVWNYELGVKSEFFNRRLRVNAAAFHQKYFNYQSSVRLTYNDVDVTTTNSAADAHENGFELEVDAKPIPDLGLHGSYALLDQAYDRILPGATGLTLATAISSAPKHEYSLSGDYTVHLGEARLVAAANWRWVGVKASGTAPTIGYTPSYGLLGANIAYNAPGDRWSIAIYGKNLTNKYYYTAYSNTLNSGIGLTTVTPGVPRELGVTVGYNFH